MSNTATTRERKGIRWGIVGPTLALACLVVIYSVYWFMVAGEVKKAVEAFAARSGEEIVTSWSDFAVGGYPFRIDWDRRRRN